MSYRSWKFVVLAAPFLLGACGEGYELVKVNDVFPYGNQRTAGSTYAYVLASLLPERELNLEPIAEAPPPAVAEVEEPPVEVVEPVPAEPPALQETKDILEELNTDLEEVFEEGQQK